MVFGAVDSGVPNVAGTDGLTFLDTVWAAAPFAGRRRFLRTVERVSADWLAGGLFTREQRRAVVAAAHRADL